MFAPGLIAIAFYRRRPSGLQITLGLVFTVVVSALLGYLQDAGTPRVWENVVLAIVTGAILYLAVLAFMLYVYLPRRARREALSPPAQTVPPP